MLLREFTVEDHIISLKEENGLYIAQITDKNGDKLLYNEYEDYEDIKSCFDKIVQAIEIDNAGIKEVIGMLERNAL